MSIHLLRATSGVPSLLAALEPGRGCACLPSLPSVLPFCLPLDSLLRGTSCPLGPDMIRSVAAMGYLSLLMTDHLRGNSEALTINVQSHTFLAIYMYSVLCVTIHYSATFGISLCLPSETNCPVPAICFTILSCSTYFVRASARFWAPSTFWSSISPLPTFC